MMKTAQRKGVPAGLLLALLLFIGVVWARLASDQAQESSGDPIATNVDLASRALLTAASTDNLIAALQDTLRSSPNNARAYTRLGFAYLQNARESGDPTYYTKTEGVLKRALELDRNNFDAMNAMGALALARHQFREALQWGERARQLSPDTAYTYGVIGDAQIELGMYNQAIDTIQKMVDLRPDLSSYSRISYARELHGDLAGAIEAMKMAVAAGGPNAENTNWTRVQLGNLYFNSGDLTAAEAQYQQALFQLPGYVHAQAGLARVRAAQGNYAEAIALLTPVTQVMPLPEYVIALGDIYRVAGRPDDAARQYDLVRAISRLFQANGVDTDLELALFDADHDQNLSDLVTRTRQAMERRPSVHAADVLAWVLYKTGRYTEAKVFSQQALRLGTRDALMLFHAGMIALRLGERDQAQTYLSQALSLNPHFSLLYAGEAAQTLQELRAESVPAAWQGDGQ